MASKLSEVPARFNSAAFYTGGVFAAARGESISSFHEARRRGEIEPPAIDEPRFVRWTGAQIEQNLAERVARARQGPSVVRDPASKGLRAEAQGPGLRCSEIGR